MITELVLKIFIDFFGTLQSSCFVISIFLNSIFHAQYLVLQLRQLVAMNEIWKKRIITSVDRIISLQTS